jgi:hypothetical protein
MFPSLICFINFIHKWCHLNSYAVILDNAIPDACKFQCLWIFYSLTDYVNVSLQVNNQCRWFCTHLQIFFLCQWMMACQWQGVSVGTFLSTLIREVSCGFDPSYLQQIWSNRQGDQKVKHIKTGVCWVSCMFKTSTSWKYSAKLRIGDECNSLTNAKTIYYIL